MEKQNAEFAPMKPIIDSKISKSKDGKWLIHKIVITDIKPVNYIEQILKSSGFRQQTREEKIQEE